MTVVACFSSVKNHNVLGPHLFPSFTTCQKNPFVTPRTVLQRAKKSLYNRLQFRTLLLPHRFIKIRPSHQPPVSIEFCRIPEFPKSEQKRKSWGNVRIWQKRDAVRRKNHRNLNKRFGINQFWSCKTLQYHRNALKHKNQEDPLVRVHVLRLIFDCTVRIFESTAYEQKIKFREWIRQELPDLIVENLTGGPGSTIQSCFPIPFTERVIWRVKRRKRRPTSTWSFSCTPPPHTVY